MCEDLCFVHKREGRGKDVEDEVGRGGGCSFASASGREGGRGGGKGGVVGGGDGGEGEELSLFLGEFSEVVGVGGGGGGGTGEG